MNAETGKTQLLASPVPLLSYSSDVVINKDINGEQHEESSELYSESTIIKFPVGVPNSLLVPVLAKNPFLLVALRGLYVAASCNNATDELISGSGRLQLESTWCILGT